MKSTQLMSLGLVALAAAACGGGAAQLATTKQAPPTANTANSVSAGTSTGSATACATRDLSVRLGHAGGASGSVYEPIVFTNTGSATCTLDGYPGVSFVAPQSGAQVGAAAARNRQHPSASVSLSPGASASAMLQIANHANFDAASCKPATVSGLRVYPPGATAAAYVAFAARQQACSTDVPQLTVEAVVSGTSG